jgi:hypothetical protein
LRDDLARGRVPLAGGAVIEDLQKVMTGGGIEAQVASVAAGEHEIGEELGVR